MLGVFRARKPRDVRAPSTPVKRKMSSTGHERANETSAPETPIKGTPVRVDPVVKSVYRYIDKKTYLDWGLTSDWSVNGPRKRRSIGGDGAPTTETATEVRARASIAGTSYRAL